MLKIQVNLPMLGWLLVCSFVYIERKKKEQTRSAYVTGARNCLDIFQAFFFFFFCMIPLRGTHFDLDNSKFTFCTVAIYPVNISIDFLIPNALSF